MGNLFSSTNGDYNSTLSTNSGSSLQSEIRIKTESLRHEARQLRSEAKATLKQPQNEYCSGCKSKATVLSMKKTDLYKQTNEKNSQAAEFIFQYYDRDQPNNVIDLHGLYVAEPLKYLQQKLDQCCAESILRLIVITGMRNNSPNKIAKIKPEVEKFARENRLKITCNHGHVVIDLITDDRNETQFPGHSSTHYFVKFEVLF